MNTRILLAAAIAVLLSPSGPAAAAAPKAAADAVDRETWRALGWDDACGVAVEILAYPKLGKAAVADPYASRAGALTIPPGQEKASARWVLKAEGPMSWDPASLAKAEAGLKEDGFSRPGYPEVIRDAPAAGAAGPAATILSTATLSARLAGGWPGPAWRWAGADYNPLGTCALLAFESRSAPPRHRLLLVRIYNPRARLDRALAHAAQARLLFESGGAEEAVAEAAAAARQAPDSAAARYAHAALLAVTGRAGEAAAELYAALKLDPDLRAKAREDDDFSDLRDRDDFKDATR